MNTWDNNSPPILQLGTDFYDQVEPARFPEQKLRYLNPSVDFPHSIDHLATFHSIPNNLPQPLALRYHGHQFQHYNPNLGDGRGFLYAQLRSTKNVQPHQWYDLGTKGSGQTPYSRAGDGRLTLKGAFREALATELLESLGVNTSKTLCFYETGENLTRHDEPSPTRSAVLTRYSLGHIRIGTFQRLAYFNQQQNTHKLISYCLNFYYAHESSHIDHTNHLQMSEKFLTLVTERCARLAAQVMIAGFVHGVLNTDNINISGELFDYGPYRFLPTYNPEFTAAYFDHNGLYCYGRQPASFLWSLHQLALSLKSATPEFEFEPVLDKFSILFSNYVQEFFLKRLNLKSKTPQENSQLLAAFFQLLQKTGSHFEKAFFDFHSGRALNQVSIRTVYEEHGSEFMRLLESYEVLDSKQAAHPYFQNTEPCTLLINEIESLWAPIASHDDWSGFEKKLQQIRNFRGLYTL